jgi:hypothetical protein
VPAAAACVRHPAATGCLPLLFIMYLLCSIIHYLFIMPLLFIYYLVPAAAACRRRPAAACCLPLLFNIHLPPLVLFIYLLWLLIC